MLDQEEESVSHLLALLDQRQEAAEEYKELKQNPLFQKLFLNNYLGSRYDKLKALLIQSVGRDEDADDIKREFQELHRFKEYLHFLEAGEKSWYYKELYRKARAGTITDEELINITGAER